MENPSKLRRCSCCFKQFETDHDFVQHMLEVDCTNLVPEPQAQRIDNSNENQETASNNEYAISCGLCDVQFLSSDELSAHNRSSEHRAQVAIAAQRYSSNVNYKGNNTAHVYSLFCNECQVPLPSHAAREIHVTGKKHRKRLAQIENELKEKKSNGSPDSATPQPFVQFPSNIIEPAVPSTSDNKVPLIDLFSNGGWPNPTASYCADSHEQTLNAVTTTSQLPTDNYAQLNALLRRLCLTQILHLIHRLDKPLTNNSNWRSDSPTSSSNPSATGVTEDVLLQMMRSVCREELQRILPPHLFA